MAQVFYRPIKATIIFNILLGILCLFVAFSVLPDFLVTACYILKLLGLYFLSFSAFHLLKVKTKIAILESKGVRFFVDKNNEIFIDFENIESLCVSEIDKFVPSPNFVSPNKIPMVVPVLEIQLRKVIEIDNEVIKNKLTNFVPMLNNLEIVNDFKTLHVLQRPVGGFEFILRKISEAMNAIEPNSINLEDTQPIHHHTVAD